MKDLLFPAMIALATAVPAVVHAAPQIAETYEAAQPLLQDDGYILFAYAEDWDTYSKKVCDKLIASSAVQQAAGNAVFMRVPVPNILTDERKEADKARYGDLKIPDSNNYPALILLTKQGRHYATITGTYMTKARPKKVAGLIKEAMQAMHKQETLLEQANSAEGVEKARLLGEAALVPGINPPDASRKIINQIKKLDPKNETGYARKLIPPFDLSVEISTIEREKDTNKPHGWQEAINRVEEYLKDPVYTNEQRQALLAVYIGILNRNKGLAAAAKIRELAHEITKLGPDTDLGKTVPTILRDWGLGVTLSEGWTPETTSVKEPVEIESLPSFSKAGTYTFTLVRDGGNHNGIVSAISLYDGDKLIAEDRHEGFVGPTKNQNNVYKLEVTTPPANPHLFIQFNQKPKYYNSWGHIELTTP